MRRSHTTIFGDRILRNPITTKAGVSYLRTENLKKHILSRSTDLHDVYPNKEFLSPSSQAYRKSSSSWHSSALRQLLLFIYFLHYFHQLLHILPFRSAYPACPRAPLFTECLEVLIMNKEATSVAVPASREHHANTCILWIVKAFPLAQL